MEGRVYSIYQIYCSKCNMGQKKKMSWRKYLAYMAFDRKSKGYHRIDTTFMSIEPKSCPFGHPIKR